MDLSSLRRAYTGHVPDLMGARGGSAVLVPLVDTADGPSLLYEIRSATVRQPNEVCFPGGKTESGENGGAVRPAGDMGGAGHPAGSGGGHR